jgi:hypothetical protein
MAVCATGALVALVLTLRVLLVTPLGSRLAVLLMVLAMELFLLTTTAWMSLTVFRRDANEVRLGNPGIVIPRFGSWEGLSEEDRSIPWESIERALLVASKEDLDAVPDVASQEWMPTPDAKRSAVFDRRRPVGRKDLPLIAIWTRDGRLFVLSAIRSETIPGSEI